MALPTIATPTYTLKVPSTNKSITYRPFLVKEEKILLMALESGDEKQMADSMKITISNCVSTEEFDVNPLALFDIEYIFLNIRAKSVGEVAEPVIKCTNEDCDEEITLSVDLTKVKVKKDRKHKKDIPLTDNIGVIMKYPDLDVVAKYEPLIGEAAAAKASQTEALFGMIRESIETIWDGEELHSTKDYTMEEIDTFINSLDTKSFEKIQQFFETMPKLQHTVKYKCEKCETEGESTLTGLQDFFF